MLPALATNVPPARLLNASRSSRRRLFAPIPLVGAIHESPAAPVTHRPRYCAPTPICFVGAGVSTARCRSMETGCGDGDRGRRKKPGGSDGRICETGQRALREAPLRGGPRLAHKTGGGGKPAFCGRSKLLPYSRREASPDASGMSGGVIENAETSVSLVGANATRGQRATRHLVYLALDGPRLNYRNRQRR